MGREERIKKLEAILVAADLINSDLIDFQQHVADWSKVAEIADKFYTDQPKLIHEGELSPDIT